MDDAPDTAPGSNVVYLASSNDKLPKPRKRKPRTTKRQTPRQLFARDTEEVGSIADHLFSASQNMNNQERQAYRARLQVVLEALRQLKEDTAEFVVEEDEDADG